MGCLKCFLGIPSLPTSVPNLSFPTTNPPHKPLTTFPPSPIPIPLNSINFFLPSLHRPPTHTFPHHFVLFHTHNLAVLSFQVTLPH